MHGPVKNFLTVDVWSTPQRRASSTPVTCAAAAADSPLLPALGPVGGGGRWAIDWDTVCLSVAVAGGGAEQGTRRRSRARLVLQARVGGCGLGAFDFWILNRVAWLHCCCCVHEGHACRRLLTGSRAPICLPPTRVAAPLCGPTEWKKGRSGGPPEDKAPLKRDNVCSAVLKCETSQDSLAVVAGHVSCWHGRWPRRLPPWSTRCTPTPPQSAPKPSGVGSKRSATSRRLRSGRPTPPAMPQATHTRARWVLENPPCPSTTRTRRAGSPHGVGGLGSPARGPALRRDDRPRQVACAGRCRRFSVTRDHFHLNRAPHRTTRAWPSV